MVGFLSRVAQFPAENIWINTHANQQNILTAI